MPSAYAVGVDPKRSPDPRPSRLRRRLLLIAVLVAGHTLIGLLVWDVQRGLARVERGVRARTDLGSGSFAISFAGFAARPAIVYAYAVTRDGAPHADAYYNPYSARIEVVPLVPLRSGPAASPAASTAR